MRITGMRLISPGLNAPHLTTMRMRRLALLMAALAPLAACGPRAIGWGVVLWGEPSGAYAHGSVVAIVRDSKINDSFFVLGLKERTPREFAHGLIREFRRKSEAAAYAKQIAQWLSSWAFSRKEDPPPLPIRGEPNPSANTVYRLRYGELVKVIGRSEQKQVVKPYEDYWYEVVTEDGNRGWTFGHLLKVFEAAGDPRQEQQRLLAQDDVLERILTTIWRPDFFRTMVSKERIDLRAFREDVGLFPDPENRLFRLGLTKQALEFRYQRMERQGTMTYAAVGTDLRITVLDSERISLSYRTGGQLAGGIYAVFPGEVAEVIAAERERRQSIFDAVRSRGALLTSSSYGTIRLEEGMRFTWQGFERLVPALIAVGSEGTGTVDFPYHVGKELAGQYDGVITLSFDGAGGEVSFLYKSTAEGVRLASLGRDSLAELDAVRLGIAPVVIFFAQSP